MQISGKIMREFNDKRQLAIQECEERTKAAYLTIPRLKEISDEKREAALELGKRLAFDKDIERDALIEKTREGVEQLDAEQEILLLENDLPIDYLRPHFDCDKCGDTGYINGGGVMCACLKQRIREERYASSAFTHDRFESFRTDIYNDERQMKLSVRVMEVCRKYSEELSYNGTAGLFLWGNTGLGKTFFLNCIANEAIENGKSVAKYTAYNFVDSIMRSIREEQAREDFFSPDLLIIDDLGTEPNIRNITFENLFAVINERIDAAKPLVLATNMTSDQVFDYYGERIFSRIMSPRHFTVIQMQGDDLRLCEKAKTL